MYWILDVEPDSITYTLNKDILVKAKAVDGPTEPFLEPQR